jgi:hypothetical protein
MSLTNFFINRKLLLLNIVLTLYIATNLVGGERGIVSFFKKKNVEKNLILEEKKLISKLNEIDKKNNLLSKNKTNKSIKLKKNHLGLDQKL